ncbi:hypothetical protein [Prescottella equi]|uniref:Uncharacterized protein n=2 Tax=Rhodococcus hoagii TaxID=43767 RepID=A0A0F6WFR1_RHOHA|nr:hypothetical protein [Prescottella equi]AKF16037.1 hypothetical protein pVAPN2012_0810 [Prescottella equi]AKG90535.1 hypothetical protein pVAPN_0810 [Prescottella equi]
MSMHSLKTIGLPLDLLSNPNRIQNSPVFPPEHRVELTLVGIIDSRRGQATRIIPIDDELRVNPAHPGAPAVALEVGTVLGDCFVFLVPVVWDSAENQWKKVADHVVAGGNFAAGGAKFEDLVEELTGASFYGAVAVHDKISPFPR